MKEDATTPRIRVLVVDDIAETRENLKKLLYFEPDMEVVGTAGRGEEAIAATRELRPDIVLLDINMPGMDGIAAGEIISQEVPQSQIIMMSVQGEADYLRRSMLAGAREFLIKPFTSEELASTIHRVHKLGFTRRLVMVRADAGADEWRGAGSPARGQRHRPCHRGLRPQGRRRVQHDHARTSRSRCRSAPPAPKSSSWTPTCSSAGRTCC